MQTLQVFQSMWAMERRHPRLPEPATADKFRRVAEAGFHGACLDPSVAEIKETLALKPYFEQHGLACMLNVFPATTDELRPLLELADAMDAALVNIIGGEMPLTVDEAVPVVERWMSESEAFDFPVLFETHRDSLLNDLYFTLLLLERVPQMRLCADLSHFVVDRELRLPLTPRDRGYINTILERADCFQGRIANREQVQVAIDFPQHQDWVTQFKAWWLDGMAAWRARNPEDACLPFLCELGPPPYAITDRQGDELSDRWEEALVIRAWAQDLWERSA